MLTPPVSAGLLVGVTRMFVLDLVESLSLTARQPVLLESDLASMQEAFLTSTTREIVPVVRVGAQDIGDGRPGPVTRRLMAAFTAAVPTVSSSPAPARPANHRLPGRPAQTPAAASGPQVPTGSSAYSVIGGHAHIRLRSPYGLSMRPTLGHTFWLRR